MSHHIRVMIRRDLPEVLTIEAASSPLPWSESEFVHLLSQKNVIGKVVEGPSDDPRYYGTILGFAVHSFTARSINVLGLAVHPDHRKRGVGRAMLDHLRAKLEHQRWDSLDLLVRESNLPGQQFLRACGVPAIEVRRDHFLTRPPSERKHEPTEDAYLFRWTIPQPAKTQTRAVSPSLGEDRSC